LKRYKVEDLKAMPDLAIGQADSLKVDTGDFRVWLSRCDEADGALTSDSVSYERLVDGRWVSCNETGDLL